MDDEGLRSLRAEAKDSNDKHWKKTLESADAYSLSEFRDFVYHSVQEHQFTISQLKSSLVELNLKFLGFVLADYTIRKEFKKHFPEKDTEFDLQNWDIFENNNPNTLCGMYQFWCHDNLN